MFGNSLHSHWFIWRAQHVVEENGDGVIVKLWTGRVVITLKLDDILITLDQQQPAQECEVREALDDCVMKSCLDNYHHC